MKFFQVHTPMASEREALKEESRMIEAGKGANGQNPNMKLLNKIHSLGAKMRLEDGAP